MEIKYDPSEGGVYENTFSCPGVPQGPEGGLNEPLPAPEAQL